MINTTSIIRLRFFFISSPLVYYNPIGKIVCQAFEQRLFLPILPACEYPPGHYLLFLPKTGAEGLYTSFNGYN
jgi:hypothetical protein